MGKGAALHRNTHRAWLVLVFICAAPSVAAAARLLRQDVSTRATAGRNPLGNYLSEFAQAHEAEARSNPRSTALVVNQATRTAYAGELYPSARSASGTHNAEQRGGRLSVKSGPLGLPMNTFGVMAQASVDTDRALAVSASEALPVMPYGRCHERRCRDALQVDAYSHGRASYALGSTTALFEQRPLRTGAGAAREAYTESISANSLPPLAAGISGAGGGPLAVAAAGEAVAMANADTLVNGGGE